MQQRNRPAADLSSDDLSDNAPINRPTRATNAATARHNRLPDGASLQHVRELPLAAGL